MGGHQANRDRISNLPAHLIDQILCGMSLGDAVRTSILSRNWRYNWTSIPHLVFDDRCIPIGSSYDKNKIVDHVLLLHQGPLYKFKLSRKDIQSTSDIDRWIFHVSRKSIKEFILHIWEGERYKVPNNLFYCDSLIQLKLYRCELKPPSSFKGFKNLKRLYLNSIAADQGVCTSLIANCPMLERLTANNIYGTGPFPPCGNVKYLSTNIEFHDLNKSLASLSFIRSFPNLKKLEISTRTKKTTPTVMLGDFWNMVDRSNSMFLKLRLVNIVGVSATVTSESDFINFMLVNSPVLQKMTVKPVSADEGLKLLKILVRFRHAEIIFLDP